MRIILTKNSKKQLRKLNIRIQQKIITTLTRFQNDLPVDIIKLKNKEQEFRIRAGDYRIQLERVKSYFLVTKICKRENFYTIFLV